MAATRSRSSVIIVLLMATVSLTAALAYEAQQAARSHRRTAENVLRDYSKFASWELARLGRQQLLNAVHQSLDEVRGAIRGGSVETALGRATACGDCGTAFYDRRTVFTMPLPGGEISSRGAPLEPEARAVIERAAAEGMRRPIDFTCPALTVVTVSGSPSVVVWRPLHDDRDRPTGIVGFVADAAFVSDVFERVIRVHPLLPPSLIPAGTDARAALTVRIGSADGTELFSSGTAWSAYAASEQLGKDLGALKLAVALRPELADALVIGGLPRDRLPLVVGLLALTCGLVIVAVVQLRRETELARLRADFVSGVSHELRTPLAQIRMFTETLLLGRVRSAAEGRRSLEIVARETQRLIQLVENVLLFSRGDRRTPQQLERQRVRLAPILRDVVEGFTPLAAARHARIMLDVNDAVNAEVDAAAVRQILLNLLDNAVKYGPEGQTITVGLTLDNGIARLTVDDEGQGIAATDAERIWQPFTRLAVRGNAAGGAGIGLSIVRQLTGLHGGRARVEASPSGGARFIIELLGAGLEPAAVSAVA